MAKNWEMGICNDKSGFLFSHECLRASEFTCAKCQKPVCEDHSHDVDGAMCCTSCVKKVRSRSETSRSGGRHGHSNYYDDPYFYGGYYYGYGYHDSYYSSSRNDPSDFTEADAESLSNEADEDFENDMSES